jgi:flavin reductase (DIM6/NTAB) family NADH-FMN oxidoreductase RutF
MSSSGTSAFHELVADLDYPMVVVTVPGSGCLVGFTTQCSIDPPRYLVFISEANHTHHHALAASSMAVHLLDERDRRIAELFGELTGDEVDKLSLVAWTEGPDGLPIIDDVAGWFAGRVLDRIDGGDHTGFVLEPFAGERRRPIDGLGYQDLKGLDPGHKP